MPDPVIIPGSVRPFISALVTSVLLAAIGIGAWTDGGAATGTVVALVGSLVAAGVLLLDLPRWTEVDADGLVRVCILRRERIPWDRVVAIERQRRMAGPGTGGLVVRGRRGRWLLTTSAEPPRIHAAVARIVAEHTTSVRMRAEPPATTTGDR